VKSLATQVESEEAIWFT